MSYFLQSPRGQEALGAQSLGSVQQVINLRDLRDVKVTLPSLPEQQAVAGVLGSLDDKIELNRRMNGTLEAMSRALFKSWFVDFDPVNANAAGQTASENWQLYKLAEVAEVVSGGTPRKSEAELWNGNLPWVSPKSMNDIHVTDTAQRVTEAAVGNGTKKVSAGAVFVMVRGMGLHDGVRISQARCDMTFNQDVKAVVPREIDPTLLLYGLLDSADRLHAHVRASGHGTGVLPTDALTDLTFMLPPPEEQPEVAAPIRVLNEQIAACHAESRTLAAIRDALLPKLLSGELSVADAMAEVPA